MSARKITLKGVKLVIYMITVTNLGPDDASNVVVQDLLSSDTTFVSALATEGGYTTKPPVGQTGVVTWFVGHMPKGVRGSALITVTVIVKGNTTITNTATVESDIFDPDMSNNTATVNVSTKGK
jgi:uncharacterized repeat protein (TIGR01451 family)